MKRLFALLIFLSLPASAEKRIDLDLWIRLARKAGMDVSLVSIKATAPGKKSMMVDMQKLRNTPPERLEKAIQDASKLLVGAHFALGGPYGLPDDITGLASGFIRDALKSVPEVPVGSHDELGVLDLDNWKLTYTYRNPKYTVTRVGILEESTDRPTAAHASNPFTKIPTGLSVYGAHSGSMTWVKTKQYLPGGNVDVFREETFILKTPRWAQPVRRTTATRYHWCASGDGKCGQGDIGKLSRISQRIVSEQLEFLSLPAGAAPKENTVASAEMASSLSRMTAQAKAVPSATLQQQATPRCGEKDVDLSSLFSPENRDQKDALACTAFASARLLEAAIRSYYGSSPHLSEADIFALLLQKGKVNPGAGIYYTAFPSTEEELDLALANGVATAKTVPYTNRFLDRYDRFMEGHEQIKNDLENGISGSKEPYALLERRASDKQSRLLNQLLVNNSPQAAAERKRIKEMLKPFKRDRQPFSKYTPDQTKATLMNYLCRGIPVSVAMDITGLPEWNHFQAQENEFAGHQIIVYGFHKAERGFVFLTRNSWGDTTHSTPSVNPEITEDRLSKISSAVALVPNSPLSEEAREKMTERMQETSSSLEARH